MTYEYVCTACGHEWEAEQKISEPKLKRCPQCKRLKAKRLAWPDQSNQPRGVARSVRVMSASTDRAIDAMEQIVRTANALGNDHTCRLLVESVEGQPFRLRRKTAIFIAGLRDHSGICSGGHEQPYGWVSQCRNCGMVVKVPRDPGGDDPIQGRAVEFDCPATGSTMGAP
jgi:putative FmdB family regulatory protein